MRAIDRKTKQSFCLRWTIKLKKRFIVNVTLFSPYKSKVSNCRFHLFFIVNKEEPQSCQFFTI